MKSIGRPLEQPLRVAGERDGLRWLACWEPMSAATDGSDADAPPSARTVAREFASPGLAGCRADRFWLRATCDARIAVELTGEFSIAGGSFAEFLPLPGGRRIAVGMADHQVLLDLARADPFAPFGDEPWFHWFELVDGLLLQKNELSVIAREVASLQRRWIYQAPEAPFELDADAASGHVEIRDGMDSRLIDRFELQRGPR